MVENFKKYNILVTSLPVFARISRINCKKHQHCMLVLSFLFLFIPKDNFFIFKSLFHIDDTLVGRTTETQGNILERFDVSTVDQNVDEREHFVGIFASRITAIIPQFPIKGEPRKTPNGFIGTFFAEAMQECNKRALVFGFKGFTAKQGQTVDVVRLARCDDLILNFACEGFAIGKIPRLRLKTFLAMVGAPRYKQYRAYPFPICDVVFL